MGTIAENLRDVQERIMRAAQKAGRSPETIRVVAVSKLQPAGVIREAVAAGAREFGENYVQEAEAKLRDVSERPTVLHLIGHLQRNKAKRAAALFDVVQSVDGIELARALGRHAAEQGRTLDVLIEVNVAGETSKFGVAPEAASDLAGAAAEVAGLRLLGLMGMGPLSGGERETRQAFRRLAELFEALPEDNRQVLSMGMTGDFEWAIAEGSTMVRVGTGIFGPRRGTDPQISQRDGAATKGDRSTDFTHDDRQLHCRSEGGD